MKHLSLILLFITAYYLSSIDQLELLLYSDIRKVLDPQTTPDSAVAKLTAKNLESLRPPNTGRLELTDGLQRGLKFRLTCNGSATWSLQLNIEGRKRRFTIGNYPEISLSEARRRAAKLRVEVLDGRDPVREKRSAKQESRNLLTVDAVLTDYDALHLKTNLRTADERLRQLTNVLAPHLDRPIAELSRLDLQQIVDEKGKSAPIAANRIRAGLSAFIGWCWRRGYVNSNFALATTRAVRELPRERLLTLGELYAIWNATEWMGELWGPFLRMLLLTAQRRGDVANMEWSEIDHSARRWEVSGTKTKNGRPHLVHLSHAALASLQEIRRRQTCPVGFVFSTTGSTPVSGFGRMKARLDGASGVTDWRLHDIRTAFATHLAEMGVDEGVVDRVLNHVASASSVSTVARVYNRAYRLRARAQALDRWGQLLTNQSAGPFCHADPLNMRR